MMTRMMRSLLYGTLVLTLVCAAVLFALGHWYWFLNFELAFISSMLILLGTFVGYRRMVQKRVEAGEGADESLLDEIEDPYALHDEEETKEELTSAQLLQEEKARLKKSSQPLKNTLKSTSGIFSPWRFLPYILLIMSFVALNNNHILDIPAFLLGLAGGIVFAVLLSKIWVKEKSTPE